MMMTPWNFKVALAFLIMIRNINAFSSQPFRMAPIADVQQSDVESMVEPLPGPLGTTDAVFLGTGGSSGTPHLHCLLATRDTRSRGDKYQPCETCRLALEGDPRHNKNYRGNPSLLIRHRTPNNGVENVLIDAGKTFREAGQRWLPQYAPSGLHAAIFTHEHADAVLGIDDLRSAQKARPMPIFTSQQCMDRLEHVFPYLMPRADENRNPRLFVASLDWRVLEGLRLDDADCADTEDVPDNADSSSSLKSSSNSATTSPEIAPRHCTFSPVEGLEVEAFAVEHGPRYLSLGFSFGPSDAKFVYISDVSRVPEYAMELLQAYDQVATLVVDCLDPGDSGFTYPTHFSLPQALELVRALRPQKTFLIGMTHAFEHFAGNERLGKLLDEEGLDVQLAYDGQCINVV